MQSLEDLLALTGQRADIPRRKRRGFTPEFGKFT